MVPSVTIVTGRGFAIGCNYTKIAIVNGEDFPGQQPSFHFFPSETLFALFAQSEYRRFRTYFWLTDLVIKYAIATDSFSSSAPGATSTRQLPQTSNALIASARSSASFWLG